MSAVAIIDYGVGNLRSVEKAFAAVGVEAIVSDDEATLRAAQKLVLPGVGAFGACMRDLRRSGFADLIIDRVKRGTPLLGVCVGMQMLFEESSEFGTTAGLGILKGCVRRFRDDLQVPHVGWNEVNQKAENGLLERIPQRSFFYFVHSYYCQPETDRTIVGETDYGVRFASVVAEGNVWGVQFHPEKSQSAGLRLLKNFANQGASLNNCAD